MDEWKKFVSERFPEASCVYLAKDMTTNRGFVIVNHNNVEGSRGWYPYRLPDGVEMLSRRRDTIRMAWKNAYLEIKKYEEGKKPEVFFKEFVR